MKQVMTRRNKITWTLGNLFMVAGLYLLVYVGGVYAEQKYNQAAARGDSSLPLEAEITQPTPTPVVIQPFVAPELGANVAVAAPVHVRLDYSTITRIRIPNIDVDSKVIEVGWVEENGVPVWQVAKYAVGHHKGSGNPGDNTNIVMAGHVGGSAPVFNRLIELQAGDQIELYSNGQQYLYVVQDSQRVQEVGVSDDQRLQNASYMNPTDDELITLITCWPPAGPNAYDQRIVVRAVPFSSSVASDTTQSNWEIR